VILDLGDPDRPMGPDGQPLGPVEPDPKRRTTISVAADIAGAGHSVNHAGTMIDNPACLVLYIPDPDVAAGNLCNAKRLVEFCPDCRTTIDPVALSAGTGRSCDGQHGAYAGHPHQRLDDSHFFESSSTEPATRGDEGSCLSYSAMIADNALAQRLLQFLAAWRADVKKVKSSSAAWSSRFPGSCGAPTFFLSRGDRFG
jgi:hypothetical protein